MAGLGLSLLCFSRADLTEEHMETENAAAAAAAAFSASSQLKEAVLGRGHAAIILGEARPVGVSRAWARVGAFPRCSSGWHQKLLTLFSYLPPACR